MVDQAVTLSGRSLAPVMGHEGGRRRHVAGGCPAFIAKGVHVAVVGLGTALAAGADENLRPRCPPS